MANRMNNTPQTHTTYMRHLSTQTRTRDPSAPARKWTEVGRLRRETGGGFALKHTHGHTRVNMHTHLRWWSRAPMLDGFVSKPRHKTELAVWEPYHSKPPVCCCGFLCVCRCVCVGCLSMRLFNVCKEVTFASVSLRTNALFFSYSDFFFCASVFQISSPAFGSGCFLHPSLNVSWILEGAEKSLDYRAYFSGG